MRHRTHSEHLRLRRRPDRQRAGGRTPRVGRCCCPGAPASCRAGTRSVSVQPALAWRAEREATHASSRSVAHGRTDPAASSTTSRSASAHSSPLNRPSRHQNRCRCLLASSALRWSCARCALELRADRARRAMGVDPVEREWLRRGKASAKVSRARRVVGGPSGVRRGLTTERRTVRSRSSSRRAKCSGAGRRRTASGPEERSGKSCLWASQRRAGARRAHRATSTLMERRGVSCLLDGTARLGEARLTQCAGEHLADADSSRREASRRPFVHEQRARHQLEPRLASSSQGSQARVRKGAQDSRTLQPGRAPATPLRRPLEREASTSSSQAAQSSRPAARDRARACWKRNGTARVSCEDARNRPATGTSCSPRGRRRVRVRADGGLGENRHHADWAERCVGVRRTTSAGLARSLTRGGVA